VADVFRFKIPKGNKIDIKPRAIIEKPEKEEDTGLINGQQAGSKLEWRVSKALDALKLDYKYQLPIGGGRMFAGGFVVDFLVYTHPLPTPLECLGEYWHGGTKDDVSYRMTKIESMMGGSAGKPAAIWEHEARTIPEAYKTLKRKLR